MSRVPLSAAVRRHLPALVLTLVLGVSVALLISVDGGGSAVPVAWPAAGLLTGLLVVSERAHRAMLLAIGGLLLVCAHLVTGYDAVGAVGAAAASTAGSWLALHRLEQGLGRRRVGLVEEGDVSRLIAAASQGAALAAVLMAGLVAATGQGSWWLTGIAVWGTHAAAQLVLVPLFVEGPGFAPIASGQERVLQSLLTVGVTVAIFTWDSAPPLVFAVMPMFAWLAFRGTLREASILLTDVAVVATVATLLGHGPVHHLSQHYEIAPELVIGFMQLFLIDCALILLPLSVMTTQQRLSAARAGTREQTMRRLVDAATGSAVIATDLDGRIQLFNPGAEQVLGVTSEEIDGQVADRLFTDTELLRQAGRVGARPIFAEICEAVADEPERQLWHFHRPDGEERSMLLAVTSLPDDRGGVIGYLCVGDDVTEREAMHRAVVTALSHEREAVDRLRELERVKSDFVATVSHELRTPLTSMIGYVELLEDGAVGELSADQRAVANRVQRNGRRLLLLVEDLLLLSQIEAREMRINPVVSDLREATRSAYDALGPLLASRHLDLVLRLPSTPVVHEGDPEQLERLVLNLVSNAVKFTPDGGRVEVVVSERQDGVEIVVLDTGMGIPADEQDQLFTRFFRASTAFEQAIQGTGLGLTIVRAIVELHSGEIAVTSSEGIGTTVSVTLPKVLPTAAPAPAASAAAADPLADL